MDVKEEIERLNKELEDEYARWEVLKMNTSLIPHTSESIWHVKLADQAMMNALLKRGIISEEELNVEYKTLMLNDMKNMRKQTQEANREAITAKPQIGVPKLHVVGKDGKGGIEL